MTSTDPSIMTTNPLVTQDQLNPTLRLVDFNAVTPDNLQQQIIKAIDNAIHFLDALTTTDLHPNAPITAKSALTDIVEFDHIKLALNRSWGVLSHLNSVMSNDAIRHVHHAMLPKLSEFSTHVGQHKALFNRYQAVKNDPNFFATLEPARQRAISLSLQNFELSGVALATADKKQYAQIQSKLSTLSANFSDNVLDATQAFALPLADSQLTGITDSGLAMLAQAGEEYKQKLRSQGINTQEEIDRLPTPYYVATLDMPLYLTIMTHADDRNLREQIYKAYVTRASELDEQTKANKGALNNKSLNNAANMTQILKLREQKAHLLGFDNYAQLSLSTKMADSTETVATFLRDLATKAAPFAKQDLSQLQQKAQSLDIDNLSHWDLAYVAEKLKQDAFKLSQEEIRPYFPLPTVIMGLFDIVNRLYGIRIVEHSQDVSLWHKDVRFYQLYNTRKARNNEDVGNVENTNDNFEDTLIGGFYFDLYARTGKRGGAWMSGFQPRYSYVLPPDAMPLNTHLDDSLSANPVSAKPVSTDLKASYHQLPVCFMVGNFTAPTHDKPSLLTHNEVITLFHEFGHGLHHLLTAVNINDVAGVNGVEWDAVELPSQIMENWAWDAEGIALISAHVDSGEPLPQDKLNALLAAKNFQSGMQTLRQIEFALFDLLIHATSPAPDYAGILSILKDVRHDIAIMPTPDYNRFANSFSHIFEGGYAAGYYSYKWAELLSADAFSKFETEGIFNPETGKAFLQSVLAVGGSLPAKTNFENFRGRPASIDALLRHSGFIDNNNASMVTDAG